MPWSTSTLVAASIQAWGVSLARDALQREVNTAVDRAECHERVNDAVG